MATNKNITMKQFNGTDYDTLYPKTIAAQIPDVFSQSETVNAEMLSKYGLGASGTPNDVFGVLSRFQNGLGNEYVWDKSQIVTVPTQTIIPASTPFAQCYSAQGTYYIRYSSSYEVVDGKFVLTNYSQITANSDSNVSVFNALKGAYFATPSTSSSFTNSLDSIFLMPSDTTITKESGYSGMSGAAYFSSVGVIKISDAHDELQHVEYLNSPDPNAYPPAVSDGYTYTSLGQLGSASHIEVISYVGTGTVGSNNPTSLTFKMPPKLFLIQVGKENVAYSNFLVARNITRGDSISGSSYYSNNITWTNLGKTVSWYCTGGWGGLSSIGADAKGQMNSSGVTYTVIAFE